MRARWLSMRHAGVVPARPVTGRTVRGAAQDRNRKRVARATRPTPAPIRPKAALRAAVQVAHVQVPVPVLVLVAVHQARPLAVSLVRATHSHAP